MGAWREISQRPSPGSWFDIWPLFLCPASAPHILLTICSQSSATSCFIIFININIIIVVVVFGCLVFFTETLSSSNSHFIFLKLCCLWNLFVNFIWELYSFSLHFFLSFPGIFSLCILLNSCSAMLKLQPFPCRGLKMLERMLKLLEISPAHLHKGEAPFSSSGLTPHDLIQNPHSGKTPLEINGYRD